MSGFEDRINENSTEFEKEFLKNYDGNLWKAIEKMKNWQPPKQQQALPVVPEQYEINQKYAKWIQKNINDFMVACTIGYTVEKPKLFYIELPNVYGLKNKVSVSKVENGTIVEFSNGKNYALKLTEQEIKSIDERYWQFAVPVEDGE